MNRSFIVAVLTVTMIIMMSTAGYAFVAPHKLSCVDCHGKFVAASSTDYPVKATNACVSCHSSSGEAARMPVEADAMSNYFGSASGQPAIGSRSSHTWGAYSSAGHPYNKAAMVHEPTNSALNTGASGTVFYGTTVCVRCHNVKADTNNVQGVDKPFLRATNANDVLCLDCHRARSTTTHTTGSHPVANRNYSSVYKSATTAYRRTPLSANSNNPTAQLGNYLTVPNKGKIVCSTCHAPHYADSSSATFGNRSTANGSAFDDPAKGLKGNLQNSKGQLLRTDPIGATANAINVCSSCHKETKNLNHNAKGQNVQCDHCHGAHVDYTGDTSLPNIYLVRRDFSNFSFSTGRLTGKKAIFNTATSSFIKPDGKGICQVCHTPTPGVAIHDQLDAKKANCLACHKHSDGFSASACDSCHGQPPVHGKEASGYTTDEAYTAHVTHATSGYYNYACKNCHYDGTRADSHNTLAKTGTATFQSVFIDTAGSVGDQPGLTKNIPAHYDTTARTCATVYCHSNGNPRVPSPGTGNAISWKSATTPAWNQGLNHAIIDTGAECITCHESGNTLVTNAHNKHVSTTLGNSIKCYVCHSATVTNSGAMDRSKHANGTKDVVFVNQPVDYVGAAFNASFNSSDATCTNSCHTNGRGVSPVTPAKWTDASTGACGTCHAAEPTTSLHPLHFSGTIGPKLGPSPDCASCHDYSLGGSKHANGVVNLKSGNSCDPCHPAAKGTPIWVAAGAVTCESCHTGTASVVLSHAITYTAPLKGLNGHSNYSTAILKHVKCTTCHNDAANHIGAGAAEKRLKITGNALCSSCHIPSIMLGMSTARANMLTHSVTISASGKNIFSKYSTLNDARARDCAGCHDTHGTSNLMSIRTVINGQAIVFNNTSTGFYVKTPNINGIYNGLCQVCHTKTDHYRNNAPYTGPIAHYTKDCLQCHTHKATPFAFTGGGGGCGGCHGYPPVANMTGLGRLNNYTNAKIYDYAGGGGAHTVAGHIPKNAKESQAWTNCSNCHYNTAHNSGGTPPKQQYVNVIVDPKFKFNNVSTIKYNASTCSNVSCHFKPSPNWVTGN